jgi:hypothetical protein
MFLLFSDYWISVLSAEYLTSFISGNESITLFPSKTGKLMVTLIKPDQTVSNNRFISGLNI